jgi:hypothetical protein
MTALVIGEERIEIKWAKRKVIFNLKMLNDRLSALDANSSEHARMRAFYSKKLMDRPCSWNGYTDSISTLKASRSLKFRMNVRVAGKISTWHGTYRIACRKAYEGLTVNPW